MKRILIAAVMTSALAVTSAANASILRRLQLQLLPDAVLSADVLLHGLPRRTPDVLSHGVRHGLRAAAVHRQPDLL